MIKLYFTITAQNITKSAWTRLKKLMIESDIAISDHKDVKILKSLRS